jgi:glutamate--cysteine ligase
MRPFLERAGTGGADMMTRTAAVQCNLDFANEGDLARKFTLASRLAPIVNAIFANSPFAAGQVSGYKSTRAAVWLKTDGSRTVTFPSTLEEEFSLERFVQDALRVPLVFVRREGSYDARVAGMSFGEYLDGGARRVNLEPCFQDWLDHLSTIFTDARLRPHLELRSADANDVPLTIATQALWRGLLYDADALDAALLIAPRLIVEDMCELSERIARDGLRAEFRGVDVLATAQEIVRLAADGLRRTFPEELRFLDPVQELILEDGMSPADVLLKNWAGTWGRRMEPVIKYLCA